MATTTLTISGVTSATGWANATPTVLNTSDDSRATGGTAAELILAALADAPADFVAVNGDITLTVEARAVGSVSRAKSILLELLDASNTVLGSGSTSSLTSSDATYTVVIAGRTDGKSSVDGWQLRATVQEGGGMADTATVEIDQLAVSVVYSTTTPQNVTGTVATASWIGIDVGILAPVSVTGLAAVSSFVALDDPVGPTIVDRYVDTASSGGDGTTTATSGANAAYSSITAALSDIGADFPSFVTSDVLVRLHCAGGDDTLSANPTAWNSTTDATRYLEIFFTGNYRIVQSNSFWSLMVFATKKVVLHGVNLLHTGGRTNDARGIDFGTGASSGWYEIDGGAILCTGAGTPSTNHQSVRVAGTSNPTVIQRNLVVSGWGKGTCPNSGFGGGRVTVVDNCTVVNCTTGIVGVRNSGDTVILRNNVAQGNTADYGVTGSGGTYTHSGNISEDASSPDAALASTAITFADEAGGDYHLAAAGTAADESGTDLSADTYGFTTDKDGVTRSVPWSSGAYEAVSASPPQNVTGSVATASWTGLTAAITAAVVVTGAVATGAWTLPAPTITSPIAITAPVASAMWTAIDASITLSGAVTGSVAIATWTANGATVSTAVSVSGGAASDTWTVPAVTLASPVALTGAVGSASWTAFDAEVAGSGSVVGSVASTAWTVPAPSITRSVAVTGPVATSAWSAFDAARSASVSLTASPAVSAWTGLAGQVGLANEATGTAAVASWTALPATIHASVTLPLAPATASWTSPAPTIGLGAISVTGGAATSTWTVYDGLRERASALVATPSGGPAILAMATSGAAITALSTGGPLLTAVRTP